MEKTADTPSAAREAYGRLTPIQRAGARIRINGALRKMSFSASPQQMQEIVTAAIRDEAAGEPLPGGPLPTGFDEPAKA